MYLLLLVLALQTPPSTSSDERVALESALNSLSKSVGELTQFLETRFASDSDSPKTGIAVSSSEKGDDNLHAVIVRTVIQNSPADRAGIRPGDRIVQIGTRHIEHETTEVVRMLTDDAGGPLNIGIRRGGENLTVIVNRTPIACLQRASARINQGVWRKRFDRMRNLIAETRACLDETGVSEQKRHAETYKRLKELFGLLNEMNGVISSELSDALARECTFKALK